MIKQSYALLLIITLVTACSSATQQPNNFITQDALVQRIQSNNAPLILDVRSAQEYSQGHIPGAINIEHKQLKKHLDQLSEFHLQEIVVHCESGMRAGMAEKILRQLGFKNILHLKGDMRAWRDNQLPLEYENRT